MSSGPAQINVTPMIDILLVLIIIFLVIAPVKTKGLDAAIPQPASNAITPEPPSRDVVVSVERDGRIQVNQQDVADGMLGTRLKEIFSMGGARHLFVRGDRDLEFQAVVRVIDTARGAGWEHVGLMTR